MRSTVRVGVATRGGVPHLVALALSHLATDFASISLVALDWEARSTASQSRYGFGI